MINGGWYSCKHVTLSKTAVLELDSAAGRGLTRGTADVEALSAILGPLFGAAAPTVIDRSTRLYFYHVSCDAPSRVPLFSFFLRKSFCFHFLLGFSLLSPLDSVMFVDRELIGIRWTEDTAEGNRLTHGENLIYFTFY